MSMHKKYTPEWWASLPPEKVGDETEKLVEELFREWNQRQWFAWHRLPDAKAGRGRIAAQPADYIYRNGRKTSGFIEVKALKHAYRLPSARLTQLPTLLKWALAGSSSLVLVHHYMEGVWRVIPPRWMEPGATSWDLRDLEAYPNAKVALESTGYFGVPV